MTARFADMLAGSIGRVGSPLCVGLDPVADRMPGEAAGASAPERFVAFGELVIDAVAGVAAAVKPQSACFERYGSAGFAALEKTCRAAKDAGLVLVLDAKRGDIGISARHYAAMVAGLGADAVTVNAYLGPETVEPYLDADLGVFVLVRTSNPGSDAVQARQLAGGETVAEMMGEHVADLGARHVGAHGVSGVGAVVGATQSHDAEALRQLMPDQVFLVPGLGAQGGAAGDLRPMLRAKRTGVADCGVLATASRSVIYPDGQGAYADRVRSAARSLASEVAAVCG